MGKKELREKIKRLKEEKNAIILAHNYQIPEVQDIADFLGDSLGLSRKAAQTDADVVVFCGVQFMAETAAILCPEKRILLPEKIAGCEMVRLFSREELQQLKEEHPEAEVVAYVNSSAETKAEADICCTSANAIEVVNSLEAKKVIFVPDKYLANYVSRHTDKKIIPASSYCPFHANISPEEIKEKRGLYPDAEVVVHPECTPEVIALADKVGSTSVMGRYARDSNAKSFIIGTEVGMIYRLKKDNSAKEFYPASEKAICRDMKLITLEKILRSLQEMKYRVEIPDVVRVKAKKAVDRMMEIR